MKYILNFKRSNGEIVEKGRTDTLKEAWDLMFKVLEDFNYTSYYQRTHFISKENNKICIDVGSYTEFFYIESDDGSDFFEDYRSFCKYFLNADNEYSNGYLSKSDNGYLNEPSDKNKTNNLESKKVLVNQLSDLYYRCSKEKVDSMKDYYFEKIKNKEQELLEVLKNE